MDTDARKLLLEKMLYARRFEERCFEAYMEREIGGFLHLYVGQEACVFGVMAAARAGEDAVITGYRDHVHGLAVGMDSKLMMAELFGKESGCCHGRGGSMHLFDLQKQFYGGYAIVGAPFALAIGLAKAIQLQKRDQIAICILGDAACNQGTFHESLNMAALWQLPVLFVCENNLYGIGTRIDRSTAVTELIERAKGCGVTGAQADGQDIEAVFEASKVAVEHVRSGQGPYFLELKTYRFRGHSMSDSNVYRDKSEEEQWAGRDPIQILKNRMLESQEITEEEYKSLDKEILDTIENEVVAFARQAPSPDVEDLEKYVLCDTDGDSEQGVNTNG